MLMQNFGVANKEYYGMLWYFWSGQFSKIWFLNSKRNPLAVKMNLVQKIRRIQ